MPTSPFGALEIRVINFRLSQEFPRRLPVDCSAGVYLLAVPMSSQLQTPWQLVKCVASRLTPVSSSPRSGARKRSERLISSCGCGGHMFFEAAVHFLIGSWGEIQCRVSQPIRAGRALPHLGVKGGEKSSAHTQVRGGKSSVLQALGDSSRRAGILNFRLVRLLGAQVRSWRSARGRLRTSSADAQLHKDKRIPLLLKSTFSILSKTCLELPSCLFGRWRLELNQR